MQPAFDPYYAWLGIPSSEQPPHHYRLLGVAPLEANPQVIHAAAERQLQSLRMQGAGPYLPLAQQLSAEVAAARQCLLTPPAKAAYDAQLAPRLGRPAAGPAPRPLPVAAPLPAAPRPLPVLQQAPPTAQEGAVPAFVSSPAKPAGSTAAKRPAKPAAPVGSGSVASMAKIIAGGIAGLILAVLILNYMAGIDLLGWSASVRKDEPGPKKVAAKTIRTVPRNSANNPYSRDLVEPGPGPQVNQNPVSRFPDNAAPRTTSPGPSPNAGNPTVPSASQNDDPGNQDPPRSLAELASPMGNPVPTSPPVKKSPVPSEDEQAARLTAIKDIYKTEFAAAKPGASPKFVDFLVTTAEKVEGDPVARYALYQEAYRQACGVPDFLTAAETLDKLEAEFELEPFRLRFDLLTKMATAVKSSDERQALAHAALDVLDHALAEGKIQEADKLARIADVQTKIIIDKELRAKAVAALQTTSDLSKDYTAVVEAREKLALAPDDPEANLAVGRYLCLVEGNWKEGLGHLAKSNDEAIQRAAVADLAGPAGDVTASSIGDVWYDLARGGKGTNFYGRADIWYQKAMTGESGLALVRLKKRHEEIAALKLPARVLGVAQERLPWPGAREMVAGSEERKITDLLALVNPQTVKPANGWSKSGSAWTSPSAAQSTAAFLEANFIPPRREYSLQARITRSAAVDSKGQQAGGVIFGLTHKGRRFALVIDELASNGQRLSYLTMGSAPEAKNSSVVRYSQIRLRSDDVACHVASDKISVYLNGSLLLQYEGDMTALALPPGSPFLPAKPFFYAQDRGINVIDQWGVGPLVQRESQPNAVKASGLR